MGKIILILGSMFSSKTSTLINYARRYKLAKKKTVLIKYSNDTRYSVDDICSHDSNSIQATFSCATLSHLLHNDAVNDSDVVLIDEGQFFVDLPMVADSLANSGKIVLISALNGTFKREEFPVISQLIPKVEEIIHLKAICVVCGEDAHFTKRKDETNDAAELIGGEDLYEARCRKCFHSDNGKLPKLLSKIDTTVIPDTVSLNDNFR